MTLEAAYAVCRGIAQREAKNFYYAFRVLPAAKRDAMCAVYAFMRRADDLADDESLPVVKRRVAMAAWLEGWQAVRAGGASDPEDAVFLALADTQRRFGISDALLEELVQGTTMDLLAEQPGVVTVTTTTVPEVGGSGQTLQVYESFEGLYRYCYLVASVVGLVCIRIFGYSEVKAEELAEQTGIAFQLTNILRDIKEDIQRGRVYLPLADLEAKGLTLEQLSLAAHGGLPGSAFTELFAFEGRRAREYYRAADRLIPLIDKDSRAALWVMVTIYRGLLERIEARNYEVFSRRVSVGTGVKLWILARGAVMAARLRVLG